MTSKRTPTLTELATLSRDEWQALCGGIIATAFQAQRVEDSRGKGNGLDGWRQGTGGPEGFQHRRFDGRFGPQQAAKLKANIELACARAPTELGGPLQRFTVVANIDLEPGHMGQPGELDRFAELRRWAMETHHVLLEWNGVGWVHAQLLRYPFLKPDLFEDLAGSLDEGFATLQKAQTNLAREFAELRAVIGAEPLRSVVTEALRHFEAGRDLNREEETLRSIATLDRALHLAEAGGDRAVIGRVLALRCGVKVLVGMLASAIVDGRRALETLQGTSAHDQLRFARGNLAFALYLSQQYQEAKDLFLALLPECEQAGEFFDVVRTVQHLTELTLNAREFALAEVFASRLALLVEALQQFGHRPGEMTVAALGTLANVRVDLGTEHGDKRELVLAEDAYIAAEKEAEALSLDRMAISARAGRAKCIWFLDRLDEAEILFLRVSKEAEPRFGKLAADAKYNRAFVLRELGRFDEAAREFRDARDRYLILGDTQSVADAERELNRTPH